MDDLLDDVTGLVGFCLVPESFESSYNVSKDSYEDEEDEELDIWTRSCYLISSL